MLIPSLARDAFTGNYPILAPRRQALPVEKGESQMSQALEGIRVIDFTHDQAGWPGSAPM
jgi:hypothetical protein